MLQVVYVHILMFSFENNSQLHKQMKIFSFVINHNHKTTIIITNSSLTHLKYTKHNKHKIAKATIYSYVITIIDIEHYMDIVGAVYLSSICLTSFLPATNNSTIYCKTPRILLYFLLQ